jgi:uncharacterized delta-60 repeat protein
MRVFFVSISLLLCLQSFSAFRVSAAPGDLDATFGTGGKVSLNFTSAVDLLRTDTIVQPDGKILVASNHWTGSSLLLSVIRLNETGGLDAAFGSGGVFQTGFGGIFSAAGALALQADGKILVGGVANAGTSPDANFALLRINPNGTLDASFGSGGKIITPFNPGFNDFVQSLAVQPDGKIVAAGYSVNGFETQSYFAVARYHANGSLDASFDGDGKLIATAGNRPINDGYALALQTDGKIVIGGGAEEEVLAQSEFAVIRLNPDGGFDTTFDFDGKAQIPVAGQAEAIHDLKIQTDGKIVAAGYSDTDLTGNGNDDFAVIRLNPDGAPDTSFDGDGKTVFSFAPQNEIEQAWGVEVQPNGKIFVSGFSGKADPNNQFPILDAAFATVRFNADGTPDQFFGENGAVRTAFQTPLNLGFGTHLQNDGKLVQVGYAGDADPETLDSRITIIRYEGDGITLTGRAPVFDFDGDGKTDVSIFRPSSGAWWYLRSLDGDDKTFAFGSSADILTPGDFTGDGKTDAAVFRPATGEWFILRSDDGSFFSFPFGAAGDIPAPADYDGDGKTDPCVFRPSTGTWFISNSGNSENSVVQFGTAEDKPVPADFDGDGKTDIAIFRPSDGSWWYLQSSNAQFKVYRFGAASDKPVPGDYTGDGRADIAVFRPASGEWFFQRSEDDSYFSVPFGTNGDIPAPGDYDGDGRFDTAVFRPSTANWFVQRSSAGILIMTFGASGDRPIPNAFIP